MLTRNGLKKRKTQLISATRISNYIKNDNVIDFLDIVNENGYTIGNNLEVTKRKINNLDDYNEPKGKKTKTSFDYIMESGNNFERNIFDEIVQLMKEKKEENKLMKIREPNIILNYNLTIQTILKKKHELILGSILLNKKNNTWGKPDILVKGSWIKKYIKDIIVIVEDNKWYVIDVKSSTINLINGGEDISSKLLYSVYKSQVYIYTEALNNLLEEYGFSNNVSHGFILGKKYKYVCNGIDIIKKSFDSLGVIDFQKYKINGLAWEDTISNAIDWITDLRTNWKTFELNPINKNELYPNMKNPYDKNHHSIKKQIATVNKEITLLWNCGVTNRKLAWDKGIYRYNDPKLNASILGFSNTDKELMIDSMLKLLHEDSIYKITNKNNFMNWQEKSKFEFYVDFETYCLDSIYDESADFGTSISSNQVIYMIGVSWLNSDLNSSSSTLDVEPNQKLSHKSFIIDYKTSNLLEKEFINNKQFDDVVYGDCILCKDELDLIIKFYNWLMNFKPYNMNINNFKKNTRLIHWSCAESIIFNKKINQHKLDNDKYNLNWFDLLKVFKDSKYPILIKECFGFGLKEVIKKLNYYNQIDISWSDLDDGLLSSFIASDIYSNKNINSDKNNNSNSNMYNIIEYNYIDCKALYKLLSWMRSKI